MKNWKMCENIELQSEFQDFRFSGLQDTTPEKLKFWQPWVYCNSQRVAGLFATDVALDFLSWVHILQSTLSPFGV